MTFSFCSNNYQLLTPVGYEQVRNKKFPYTNMFANFQYRDIRPHGFHCLIYNYRALISGPMNANGLSNELRKVTFTLVWADVSIASLNSGRKSIWWLWSFHTGNRRPHGKLIFTNNLNLCSKLSNTPLYFNIS